MKEFPEIYEDYCLASFGFSAVSDREFSEKISQDFDGELRKPLIMNGDIIKYPHNKLPHWWADPAAEVSYEMVVVPAISKGSGKAVGASKDGISGKNENDVGKGP